MNPLQQGLKHDIGTIAPVGKTSCNNESTTTRIETCFFLALPIIIYGCNNESTTTRIETCR